MAVIVLSRVAPVARLRAALSDCSLEACTRLLASHRDSTEVTANLAFRSKQADLIVLSLVRPVTCLYLVPLRVKSHPLCRSLRSHSSLAVAVRHRRPLCWFRARPVSCCPGHVPESHGPPQPSRPATTVPTGAASALARCLGESQGSRSTSLTSTRAPPWTKPHAPCSWPSSALPARRPPAEAFGARGLGRALGAARPARHGPHRWRHHHEALGTSTATISEVGSAEHDAPSAPDLPVGFTSLNLSPDFAERIRSLLANTLPVLAGHGSALTNTHCWKRDARSSCWHRQETLGSARGIRGGQTALGGTPFGGSASAS